MEKSRDGFLRVAGYGQIDWLTPDYLADLLRSDLDNEFPGGGPGLEIAVGLSDLG